MDARSIYSSEVSRPPEPGINDTIAPMQSRRSFTGSLLAAPFAAAPPGDPADLTVIEAVTMIRQGKLTPVELTEACLKRIEKLNPRLNAFITVLGDQALAQARSLRLSSRLDAAAPRYPDRAEGYL